MMESEVCGLYAQPKEIESRLKLTKTIFNVVKSVDFTYSSYLSNASQKIRHKKGRRAQPRNGFYIVFVVGLKVSCCMSLAWY